MLETFLGFIVCASKKNLKKCLSFKSFWIIAIEAFKTDISLYLKQSQ